MPSSYTSSARFTLQATGENNNTWGVILNSGVFQLVDDTINGRIGLSLSGAHTLTVNLGATDEARMAFIDVTGGSGGTITIPSVPKSYFLHNAAAGVVNLSAGGALVGFNAGDAGPVFTDGTTIYPVLIGGLTIKGYTDGQIAILKAYVDAQIAGSIINMPPVTGKAGQLLTNDGTNAFWTATLATFAFTSTVTVPTKAQHDNSINAASTAYVDAAVPLAYGWRNRIINGDMRVDQRHGGALTAIAAGVVNVVAIDRWKVSAGAGTAALSGQQVAVGSWSPLSYSKTALAVICTALQASYTAGQHVELFQVIEGLNLVDLHWGQADAQPVTISFVTVVSFGGDYGFSITNAAGTFSYVHKVTLVGGVVTKVSFTIPGPTVGVWNIDNSVGLYLRLSLACGATWQTATLDAWTAGNLMAPTTIVNMCSAVNQSILLSDVQFEVGSVASAFERRAFVTELSLCQRYYETNVDYGDIAADDHGQQFYPATAYQTNGVYAGWVYRVPKRAIPTILSAFRLPAAVTGTIGGTVGQAKILSNAVWTPGSGTGFSNQTTLGATVVTTMTIANGFGCVMGVTLSADAEL